MHFRYYSIIFIGFLVSLYANTQPQSNTTGIGSDEYQEHFFEALKQKSIENYDLAIDALQKCLTLAENDHVVFFELGKNYVALKQFEDAAFYLNKAIAQNPNNEWYLDQLYDVYVQQDATEKAIETLKKLTKFHPDYQQDLATLYIKTQHYDQALSVLDALDKKFGVSEVRASMRESIYEQTGDTKGSIGFIESQLQNAPQNEDLYLKLIYRLTQSGNTESAFSVAKDMQQKLPNSKKVHLALYKFYLSNKDIDHAVNSIKIALTSSEIDPATKTKVLSDFVDFTEQNPQYKNQLADVVAVADTKKDAKGYYNLGQYYLKLNQKEKARQQFAAGLEKEPQNFKMLKALLLVQIDLEAYDFVAKKSSEALEIYPAQAILYLINGVANNTIGQPQKAIDNLEIGLDYVIDDVTMERDFYTQLSIAYKAINNISKYSTFVKKAEALKAQ